MHGRCTRSDEEGSSRLRASACASAGGDGGRAGRGAAVGGAGAAVADDFSLAGASQSQPHTDMESRWLAALQRRELQPLTHGPPPSLDAVASSTAALAKAEAKRLLGVV